MALTKLTKNLIDGTFGTEWVSTIQTSNFTAEAAKGYFVNTTAGTITINLPAGVVGTEIVIQDYAGTFATNNVLLNAYISYKPIENLTLKATGAIRNRSTFNNIFNKKVRNVFPDGTSYFAPDSDRNRSNESIEFFTETYFVTADYNIDLGEGNLKALVGYSQEENSISNFLASRDGHLTRCHRNNDLQYQRK